MLRKPMWWRVIGYAAVFLPFLFFVGSLWIIPDWNRQQIPDWRPVLALAEASRDKGDLHEARALYSQVGRLASWREDWEGLLAAACGFQEMDRERRPYSLTHTLLFRAMVAAEVRQSPSGMATVAKAFAAIGEHKAASMLLARIQARWPEEMKKFDGVDAGDCWQALQP